MFWYVIGFCAFVVALLSLWVNAGRVRYAGRRYPAIGL
ncbi:Uncharacterised protein [Neisseria meningitidis]|nr:Uncharacterised protein [Neisseria meningitidis]